MIKLVLDTNILISAIISKGNEYELLKLAKLRKFKLILSPVILKEFIDVISRQKFGFTKTQINDVFKQLIYIAKIIIPTIKLNIIKKDPSDNKFIECAVQSNADYIVSGDKHLLKLKQYKKIKIVKTKEILDLL